MDSAKSFRITKKTVITVVVGIVILAAAAVFFVYDSATGVYEHTGYAMGSEISASFYGSNNSEAAEELFNAISQTEIKYISRTKEGSDIFRLNKDKQAEVSAFTQTVLTDTLAVCSDSSGALDITVGELSSLWSFDGKNNALPEQTELQEALAWVDYRDVLVDTGTVQIGENQSIDLGAVGKGLACDVAREVLEKNGISRAIVSVGGTVMTYTDGTEKFDFGSWGIAVKTPERDSSMPLLRIDITENAVVSTSGNYEKCFEKDGKLYHHILSPETGYPAESSLAGVTVIAEKGIYADALSTACYVLGMEKSQDILKKYNAQAIFVDNDKNIYVSDGLRDSCTLLNEEYTIVAYE